MEYGTLKIFDLEDTESSFQDDSQMASFYICRSYLDESTLERTDTRIVP